MKVEDSVLLLFSFGLVSVPLIILEDVVFRVPHKNALCCVSSSVAGLVCNKCADTDRFNFPPLVKGTTKLRTTRFYEPPDCVFSPLSASFPPHYFGCSLN